MNRVILAGNITKDVELQTSDSGVDYVQNSIALRGYKKDQTEFVNWAAFGKTAEMIAEYFTKGSAILLEGRLSTNDKGYTNVIVDRWEFTYASSRKTADDEEYDEDDYEDDEEDEDEEEYEDEDEEEDDDDWEE